MKAVRYGLGYLCSDSIELMAAAEQSHLEVCQVLISAGADVNAIDEGYHV